MVRLMTILILFALVVFLGFMSGGLKVNHERFKCIRAHNNATEWNTIYTLAGVDLRWPSFTRTCEIKVDPVTNQVFQTSE